MIPNPIAGTEGLWKVDGSEVELKLWVDLGDVTRDVVLRVKSDHFMEPSDAISWHGWAPEEPIWRTFARELFDEGQRLTLAVGPRDPAQKGFRVWNSIEWDWTREYICRVTPGGLPMLIEAT